MATEARGRSSTSRNDERRRTPRERQTIPRCFGVAPLDGEDGRAREQSPAITGADLERAIEVGKCCREFVTALLDGCAEHEHIAPDVGRDPPWRECRLRVA